MSKKSDEIAARQKALGLSVISNDRAPADMPASGRSAADQMVSSGFSRNHSGASSMRPGGVITSHSEMFVPAHAEVPPEAKAPELMLASVGGDETLDAKASQFASYLKAYHHENIGPFSFLGEVPIPITEMPATDILNRATELLRAKGWSVSVSLPTSTEVGSIMMMDSHHTGF